MQVLLEGKKAIETKLVKCHICGSILEEKSVLIKITVFCPLCESIIHNLRWREKGSAEYEDLEKEVALYSI